MKLKPNIAYRAAQPAFLHNTHFDLVDRINMAKSSHIAIQIGLNETHTQGPDQDGKPDPEVPSSTIWIYAPRRWGFVNAPAHMCLRCPSFSCCTAN